MTTTTQTVRAATASVLLAALLSGCGGALPEQNMQTPDETHDAVRDTLTSTIELLGGPDGWSEYYDNPPTSCALNGEDGVYYTEDQIGPGTGSIEARDATVERVQEHLESLGMQTWLGERVESDPLVYLYASDGPTAKFHAYVGPDHIALAGESWCVPGNAKEMILGYR